jgi:serine/threonine protein kinase/tetratricopeptide (TPR) repeat protein
VVIGKTVSHYTILERLGGGGMGVVYKAEDTRLKRLVALKFLPPELTRDEAAKERFEREARTASALDHPNVCTIHEIDETADGQVFICMAFYDGESLKSRLARGPLSFDETLTIAIPLAEGLAQAHEHGIVHRDIKPANVMLTADGIPKIVDFGIATLLGRPHTGGAGEIAGTVSYMSPEQARGDALDQRTDIWSLGVTVYEMLTARLPFLAEAEQPLLHAITHQDPPPLESLRTGVPAPLAEIVAKCLRKRPDERYQHTSELIAELKRVRRTLTSATVSTLPARPPVSSVRRRLRPAITLPVGVAMIALALLAAVPAVRDALRGVLGVPNVPDQHHMAVLPFTNIGDDPANRVFCDGLTEILSSQLTQVERYQNSLSIVPESELKAREVKAPSEARRLFGVNLALTGSVQRSRDSVRLALNLVDAARSRQLRSRVIDEPLTNLTALEDRAVSAVMKMLDLELQPEARQTLAAGNTANSEAQDAYVQALGALHSSLGPSDPELAITMLKRAVALDPRFTLAQAALGEAYLAYYRNTKDRRLLDDATAACQRAAELDKSLPQVQITLGLIGMATGKYEQGVTAFQRAVQLDPSDAQAFVELGRAFTKLQKAPEAEAAYKKALALKPNYWLGYSRLARFYWLQSRYKEAEGLYRKGLDLTPDNYLLLTDLGALYFDLSRLEEARRMFERSVQAKPNYIAYSNLGTLASQRSDWKDAAAMYERARELDDRDYVLWGNLGAAYQHLPGEDTRARAAYSKAIELAEKSLTVDPRDSQVMVDLAGYHAALGNKERALQYVRQVEATAKEQPDLARQLVQVFVDLRENDRALEWIATALKLGHPVGEIEAAPSLRQLRSDPRFQVLAERYRTKNMK